jgi:exosome complex component RRP43
MESSIIPAEVFRAIHPKTFLLRFIEKNVRPDHRGLTEFRKPSIHTHILSTCEGSAVVKLGSTCIMCGIRLEVTQPKWDFPEHGYISKMLRKGQEAFSIYSE